MTQQDVSSFAEVTLAEAAARRLRVDLVLDPVVKGSQRRLISQFFGLGPGDGLVLAPPQTPGGSKVYLPLGWKLGMAFELSGFWVQARTTVLEHCQFPALPDRRVDAVVVKRPTEIVSLTRRCARRYAPALAKRPVVRIWPEGALGSPDLEPLDVGELVNWSEGASGLGVRLPEALTMPIGARAVISLERSGMEDCRMLWGTLKHCSQDGEGSWVAGFGDLEEVGAGEAGDLAEFLAAPAD